MAVHSQILSYLLVQTIGTNLTGTKSRYQILITTASPMCRLFNTAVKCPTCGHKYRTSSCSQPCINIPATGRFGDCQVGTKTIHGEQFGVECANCRAKRAAVEKEKLVAVKG